MPVHNIHPIAVAEPPPTGPAPLPPTILLRDAGLLLHVVISQPEALAASILAKNESLPPDQTGVALIDTGASVSCVHEPIVQALGLQPTGTIMLGGAAGTKEHNKYQVKASFPGSPLPDLELNVVGVNLEGQNNKIALVGMDILHQCLLIYNGPQGSFTLAF